MLEELKAITLFFFQSEALSGKVITLGVCDLETDIFFQLYKESTIKPQFCQINLKSCCMVPPDLQEFAKSNSVKLSTHADPPTVLSVDFMEKIENNDLRPEWIAQCLEVFEKYFLFFDPQYLMKGRKTIFTFL